MKFIFQGAARIGFRLALGILIVIAVLSYLSNRSLVRTEEAALRGQEVIDQLDDLLAEILQTESSSRGYLASGQDFYLEPYYAASSGIDSTLAALQVTAAADSTVRQQLESLKAFIAEESAFNRRLLALSKEGAETASLQLFLTGQGHALMDRTREQIGLMRDRENRELRNRTAVARRNSDWSILTLVVGSFLGFAILVWVYRHLTQEIAGRRRSERKVLQLNRLYAVLSHVSQTIVHIRERDALFREVCRIAVEDGQFRMAWVGVVDAKTGVLEPVASAGFEDGYLGQIRITTGDAPEGPGLSELALREQRHLICPDIVTDPGVLPWRDRALSRGYRSLAAFPLQCGGLLAAVFTVYAAEPRFFDEENVTLLNEVVSDVSFALERMEAEAQRQEDAARRQRAEQEILRLNEDLERRVTERTAELARVASELEARNREVERANRMKTEFLTRASHELRTPLNAIIGYSTLLAEEPAGPLLPKYKRFVANIQEGSRHLLDMVNELLDLSKIEAGRIDLNREWFESAKALEEVLSVITPLAKIKNIAIDNRFEPDTINADRTRFKQILYNLLSNAVKFTPENGCVWIDGCSRDDIACFCVGDNGIGIPDEELGAVFEEFHQVGVPSGEGQEGSGLGLAITRRLVELHGGNLWVESCLGQGSRFFFSLGPASIERTVAAQREV